MTVHSLSHVSRRKSVRFYPLWHLFSTSDSSAGKIHERARNSEIITRERSAGVYFAPPRVVHGKKRVLCSRGGRGWMRGFGRVLRCGWGRRVRIYWGMGCVDFSNCIVMWCVNLNVGMDAAGWVRGWTKRGCWVKRWESGRMDGKKDARVNERIYRCVEGWNKS